MSRNPLGEQLAALDDWFHYSNSLACDLKVAWMYLRLGSSMILALLKLGLEVAKLVSLTFLLVLPIPKILNKIIFISNNQLSTIQ